MPRSLPFPVPADPPPARGPLLTAEQAAALIGGVSPAWVRRVLPGKLDLGQRTKRWYRADVEAWLEARRTSPDP